MEKLTYLVANYNCSAYVAECIRSVASQTDPRWSCIVCDDTSTDGSVDVIERTIQELGGDSRIRLLKNARNLGYIGTLKVLIEAAATDIVAILDADDSISPEATAVILDAYANHADAGFVYSQYQAIDQQSQIIAPASPLSSAVPAGKTTLLFGFVSHLKTFRKKVYQQTSGLDETLRFAEDRDLVYKLEEIAAPYFVKQVLYNYRLVPGSQSRDESKFRTGIVNHVLARRNAIARRGLTAGDRLLHASINACLLARSKGDEGLGVVWIPLASFLLRVIRGIVRVTNHSSGLIRRTNRPHVERV